MRSNESAPNLTSQTSSAVTASEFRDAAMTYTNGNRINSYNNTTIQYDGAGNMTYGPLNGLLITYTYDKFNRLTSAGNAQYAYDGEGTRISLTAGGAATGFVIDPVAEFSRLLLKTNANETQQIYVYGLGLLSRETKTVSNGIASYQDYRLYHFDSKANTTSLTNASGQITDAFSYTPYGEEVTQSGATPTIFKFAGRFGVQTDENALVYMRARYYNTDIRRFLNVDPIEDGVNWYIYANGNPLSYADPNGQFALSLTLLTTLAITFATGALFSGIMSYGGALLSGASQKEALHETFKGAISGGVSSVVAALAAPLGPWGAAVAGEVAQSFTYGLLNRDPLTKILEETVLGVVFETAAFELSSYADDVLNISTSKHKLIANAEAEPDVPIHSNSHKSTKPNYLYVLVDENIDEKTLDSILKMKDLSDLDTLDALKALTPEEASFIKKIGETSAVRKLKNGNIPNLDAPDITRYSKKFYAKNKVELIIIHKGLKKDNYYLQHDMIMAYTKKFAARPKLNKSDW